MCIQGRWGGEDIACGEGRRRRGCHQVPPHVTDDSLCLVRLAGNVVCIDTELHCISLLAPLYQDLESRNTCMRGWAQS